MIIPSVDKADIESYEIYTEDEICLLSTEDEREFIDMLFSLGGTVVIRINSCEISYMGIVTI